MDHLTTAQNNRFPRLHRDSCKSRRRRAFDCPNADSWQVGAPILTRLFQLDENASPIIAPKGSRPIDQGIGSFGRLDTENVSIVNDSGLTNIDCANGLNYFDAAHDIFPFTVIWLTGTKGALRCQEIGKHVVDRNHIEPLAFELVDHDSEQSIVATRAEKFRQHRCATPVEP